MSKRVKVLPKGQIEWAVWSHFRSNHKQHAKVADVVAATSEDAIKLSLQTERGKNWIKQKDTFWAEPKHWTPPVATVRPVQPTSPQPKKEPVMAKNEKADKTEKATTKGKADKAEKKEKKAAPESTRPKWNGFGMCSVLRYCGVKLGMTATQAKHVATKCGFEPSDATVNRTLRKTFRIEMPKFKEDQVADLKRWAAKAPAEPEPKRAKKDKGDKKRVKAKAKDGERVKAKDAPAKEGKPERTRVKTEGEETPARVKVAPAAD